MSKIFNLILNELIKQFKKVSTKVFLALILIFAVAMPWAIKSFESTENRFWIENHKNELSSVESEISGITNPNSKEGKLILTFRNIDKEVVKTKIDNNIEYNWRNEEIEQYRQLRYEEEAIKAVLNKANKKSLASAAYHLEPTKMDEIYSETTEKLKKKLEKVSNEAKTKKDIVINNDYLRYTEAKIKGTEETIKNNNKEIKENQKLLKKDPKNKGLQEAILSLEANNELQLKHMEIDKYRLNNKIPFDDKDYRHRTLDDIAMNVSTLNQKMVTEEEFLKNPQGYSHMGKTYEMYRENVIAEKERAKKDIDLAWYSLNNNIPMEKFTTDSRTMTSQGFEIFVVISGILSIILAGSIVSSEFSKGTIRLLLIRPVSRFKVLTSKLAAVLLIGFSILTLSIGAYIVSTGFAYGFDAFSISSLEYVNGKVVEVGYFSYLIPKILTSCVSILFVVSLSFMLSTVAKNTAVAVGLSSILYLGSMPISMILGSLKAGFIAQYVLGYMNLSMFNIMPSFPIMMKEQYGVTLDPQTGVIQLLVLTGIFVVVSFVSFIKTDVKN